MWAAKRERERERERHVGRSNAVFIVFFQSRVGEEEEEEGFPTMKRKGFTVESRVKRFVLGRAHKATSILKSKTKFHYARAKRAAKRIMGSKRARRAIRATRKYASGTCKKTMAIAKETRTKAVSFVRTKSNQIWTSVDAEFLSRAAMTILICYLSLYAISNARNREENNLSKALAAFISAAFLSIKFDVVPDEYVNMGANAIKKMPTYVAWMRKYARKVAKTYIHPKTLKKMDKFVKMYSFEVKIGLVLLFFVGWWFLSAFVFGNAANKNKPISPTNQQKKGKKKRVKGPIEINVVLVTGASGNVGSKILSQMRRRYPDYIVYGTSRSGSVDFKAGNALQSMFEMMSPNSKNVASTSLVNVPLCCSDINEIPPLLRMDVTDDDSVNAVRDAIVARHGKGSLRILVNNAGICAASLAVNTPVDLAKKVLETNYYGMLRVVAAFYPEAIPKHQNATIVNVGSIAGRIGIPFQSSYSSSKAAVEVYTDALRMESKRDGVRACLIEPGDLQPGMECEHTPEIETDEVAKRAVNIMRSDEKNGSNPMKVAYAVCKAARPWRTPRARILVGPDAWLVEICTSYLWKSVQEMFLAAHYRIPPRHNSLWRFVV